MYSIGLGNRHREYVIFAAWRRSEYSRLPLINRTEQLAQTLIEEPPAYTLCHADIHGWNLLIEKNGDFYIVDWDTLIVAPKERDLMFVGCGLGGIGYSPEEEQALFFEGYGNAEINESALAYYRFERIIEDIAVDAGLNWSGRGSPTGACESLCEL